MEPVWLKSYEPGIPHTIDPDAYPNLNAFFEPVFAKFKDLPAYTNLGQVLTYEEVNTQANQFASFLQNDLELPKGSRVAIMMPNIMQYPIAMLGILRAGCTVVNVNPLYTADEFIIQVRDADARTIVVLENFAHIVSQALLDTALKNIIITKISDMFTPPKSWLIDFTVRYIKRMVPAWSLEKFCWYKDVIEAGKKTPLKPVDVGPQDLAFLQYTGGTTGRAKGAMLTHRNMVANVTQASAWLRNCFSEGQEILVTALPLYHIFSLTANCLTWLNYGGLNILITDPRDRKSFVKELRRHKFTGITGVNTLFNLLINTPEFSKVDFKQLKMALGGGMAVLKVVADKWKAMTGVPILEAYGLTETSPAACINPLGLKEYNGTVGLPISSTEVSIRDDNGVELGFDEPGVLFIRGPQVMKGYWRNDEETKKVLSSDGWVNTGDVAKINAQGYVTIVDRKKDVIVMSGFKIYPNEVEDVLAAMPGIKEVAIVGAPDPVTGEKVRAFIVRSDENLTAEDVRAYAKEHLTGYKVPREVEFRSSLPKSNVGKILRKDLK